MVNDNQKNINQHNSSKLHQENSSENSKKFPLVVGLIVVVLLLVIFCIYLILETNEISGKAAELVSEINQLKLESKANATLQNIKDEITKIEDYYKTAKENLKIPKEIMLALYWLRDHQNEDGSWSADGFHSQCGQSSNKDEVKFLREGKCTNSDETDDSGLKPMSVGVTGLALLAYLSAGFSSEQGEFKGTINKAVNCILTTQTDDGCFGTKNDQHFVYNHALCTKALAQAYIISKDARLLPAIKRAVDFIALAQNEDSEQGHLGWRYGVKPGESDSSVTGNMLDALHTAKLAGIDVPQHCFDGGIRALDDKTGEVNGNYRTGYLSKAGPGARINPYQLPYPTMDCINIICQLKTDKPYLMQMIYSQANTILKEVNLPSAKDPYKIDYYYWYFGTRAMFNIRELVFDKDSKLHPEGARFWKKWRVPMIETLKDLQRLEDSKSCVYGSWDTKSAWGSYGGRVYATAINAITLAYCHEYNFIK